MLITFIKSNKECASAFFCQHEKLVFGLPTPSAKYFVPSLHHPCLCLALPSCLPSSLAGCWLRRHSPFACSGKKKYAAVPKLISSLPGSGHLPMLRSCPHMGLVSALAGWYSTKPGSGSAPWAAKQQHLRSLVPQRLLSAVRCAVCWPATGDWPQVIIHVICTLLETAQRESLKVQRMDHFRSQRTELVKGSCR